MRVHCVIMSSLRQSVTGRMGVYNEQGCVYKLEMWSDS